ncbi:MAG: lysylphosphatidylglycerol synthase domain-containing protein [Actinomycetes bacterium]
MTTDGKETGDQNGGPERRRLFGAERYAWVRASIGRHPADALRMAIATGIVFACLFIAAVPEINPVEAAIFEELQRIPFIPSQLWRAITWAGSWPGIVVLAGSALYVGRVRTAVSLTAASLTAWLLVVVLWWVTPKRPLPVGVGDVLREPAAGFHFPSLHVAVIAALVGVGAPYLGRLVRYLAWALVVLVGVADVFLGYQLPVGIVAGAALGWGSGAFYHLVLGAPRRRTSEQAVQAALASVGLPEVEVVPVRRRFLHPQEYLLTTPAGERLQMKVVRRLHRQAGPVHKLRRLFASIDVEDEPGLSTPRHEVDHEAYISLLAERAGIGTLPVVSTGEIRHGPPFVVRQWPEGRLLSAVPPHEVDDEALDALWHDVLALGEQSIAHHDLRAGNILLDSQGRPRIADFTFSRVGASERHRYQDVADLLVTLASVVGVPRALDSAVRQVPEQTLRETLPGLQWLALHRRLRRQLRDERLTLTAVREGLADRLGAPPPQFRSPVRPVTLVVLLALGLAIYLLLPQISSFQAVLASLSEADRRWIAVAVLVGLLSVLASGLTLLGSCPTPLPFWTTMWVQLAAAFTGRTTAAGLGFYGINITYLERLGVRRGHAVGVMLLNRVVVTAVTGLATVLGIAVIGRAVPVGRIRMPGWRVEVAALVVLVAVIAFLCSPFGRRKVWLPLATSVREFVHDLLPTLRSPVRSLQLFGGAILFIALQGAGLAATLAAFGETFSLLSVLAVYVVGSTLGQLAPTPGGLGTVEAATVAGLTAIGVGSTAAVAAVLASRVLTFWLPVIPGIAAFRLLQHRGVV